MSSGSDGIEPGLDLGSRELVITPDWIQKYVDSIDGHNPWYTDDSPFGGPIAPAAVFNYEMELFEGWHPPDIKGRILATEETWEFHRPMRPGQRVLLKGRVQDRYERRGREYIAMEATAWDEQGRLLCRMVTTHAWPIRTPDPVDEPAS
jgi:hypothetical protein